ncbi:RNA-directed DNA methylation 4 isoform X1 [Actinidia eriantha]|uniref:RNA-directed DNA methylation 4 isoform X1 n=1 Tax=Actinidia eriantha TaxID=165200 RepID=UPI0025892C19|nr:RNA-directed DNA methylation 4 isoform X1 [Actinidia eriantha]
MTDIGASSSSPSKDDKPVIVRVKRKAYHSPLEAFWLEINERPLKRQLLGLEKLSISDTPQQVKGLKPKKVFVQHVETISSSEDTIDVLQSFVPNSVDGHESKAKNDERRHTFKTENKQDKLLVKAKQKQEVLSKNARFEQIWRSRKGKKEEKHDQALRKMCQVYDVVRVDVEETMKEVHEQDSDTDLEDHRIMSTYLPLLREFIPSAAAEIESDIHNYMSQRGSKDDYVYDLYAVKDDINVTEEDASNPFPLVQVNDDDEFYAGPVVSNSESDDSNAEDNPLNDYPDEETSEDDDEDSGSKTSNDESEERDNESASNKSSEPEDSDHQNWLEDADPLYEDYMCGDDDDGEGEGGGDAYYCDDDVRDNDDQRWSYR